MEKPQQFTWIASLNQIPESEREIPRGYTTRAMTEGDKATLADLYFAVYPKEIVRSPSEALDEMERTFRGEYGCLDFAASPLAFDLLESSW